MLEELDHLHAPRRVQLSPSAAPSGEPRPRRLPVEPRGLGVRPSVDEGGKQVESIGCAIADEVEVLQLDGTP
ncbi:MAG TPA: hypothetical protein VK461_05905, partial [Acidimicrobiales bacterium]|nr:hypothetical protein [Acidimicrobiales bacterium]